VSIISRMRKQRAVFWAASGVSESGLLLWDDPVEIPVRWEETREALQFTRLDREIDPGVDETLRFRADVYVDREVRVGDYLMLGSLASSTSPDPRDEESWEVQAFSKIPNIKAKENLYSVVMSPSHLKLKALHGRGIEAVAYYRETGQQVGLDGRIDRSLAGTTISVAIRGRPRADEGMEVGGKFTKVEVVWMVPKHELPVEPDLRDFLVDSLGLRWDVLGWGDGSMRSWWRVPARRGLRQR
jgi:hypothetical protein